MKLGQEYELNEELNWMTKRRILYACFIVRRYFQRSSCICQHLCIRTFTEMIFLGRPRNDWPRKENMARQTIQFSYVHISNWERKECPWSFANNFIAFLVSEKLYSTTPTRSKICSLSPPLYLPRTATERGDYAFFDRFDWCDPRHPLSQIIKS